MEKISSPPLSRLFLQVSRRAGTAMRDYRMLQNGHRVAVVVSGA